MTKKILSAAAMMLLTLACAMSANAAGGTINGLKYSIDDDNNVTITGYSGGNNDVVIPATIDGNAVTAIGNSAFYSTQVKNVTIPEGVTTIGNAAFRYCKLTSVNIPSTVSNIGQQAFMQCTNLTTATISDGVKSIGDSMFYKSGLTSITIPSSVTSIAENAFNECAGLTSVTIPATVKSVGNNTFNECTGLTSATVLCENVSQAMFMKCTSLTDVTLKNTKSIGLMAFYSCTNLKDVVIPEGVTSIGQAAFNSCTSMVNLTVPKSVTSISMYAFSGCSGLKSVTVSKNHINKSTGSGIFNNCNVDELYFDGTKREWDNSPVSINAKKMYYYTTDAEKAQTEYKSNTDKATGFTAKITNDYTDGLYEVVDKLMWRITSGGKTAKASAELENKITLEPGASATFGIVLDGLYDENATATISAEDVTYTYAD